jgi:hypothetical protein
VIAGALGTGPEAMRRRAGLQRTLDLLDERK